MAFVNTINNKKIKKVWITFKVCFLFFYICIKQINIPHYTSNLSEKYTKFKDVNNQNKVHVNSKKRLQQLLDVKFCHFLKWNKSYSKFMCFLIKNTQFQHFFHLIYFSCLIKKNYLIDDTFSATPCINKRN